MISGTLTPQKMKASIQEKVVAGAAPTKHGSEFTHLTFAKLDRYRTREGFRG